MYIQIHIQQMNAVVCVAMSTQQLRVLCTYIIVCTGCACAKWYKLTSVHPLCQLTNLVLLLSIYGLVATQEREVGLWCDVRRTSIAFEVLQTHFSDKVMKNAHGLHHPLLHVRRADNLVVREVVLGNSNECVLGPTAEPVHGAATDETGEFEAAVSELLTHRGEAEDNVEVLPSSGDEVVVEVLLCGWGSGKLLLHDGDQVACDFIQLISGKEIGHLEQTGAGGIKKMTHSSTHKAHIISFPHNQTTHSKVCSPYT